MKRALPVLMLLLLAPFCAGQRLFLELEGIPGESSDPRHKDWVEASGFAEGLNHPVDGRNEFGSLRLIKALDKSSPKLALRCASGESLKYAHLDVVRAEDTSLAFLQIRLTNVTVISFEQAGAAGGIPGEEFGLNFVTVEWTYTQFEAKGKPLAEIQCSWDRVTSQGTGGGEDGTVDTDGDGLPDDYERRYGLNPEVNDAALDLDGDGVSNLDEFRAGTIPNNRDSVFRMTGRRSASGEVELTWAPAEGKTYRLLSAPSPEGPYEFFRDANGVGGTIRLQSAGARQFFIIEVQ